MLVSGAPTGNWRESVAVARLGVDTGAQGI